MSTQDGLVLEKTVFEEEELDLSSLDWRVGFVQSRQWDDSTYIEFSDRIGSFELVKVSSNGTYAETAKSFETFNLRECSPGTATDRKDYDSMLKSSDKLYCPPEDIEMSVTGDVQSQNFTYWML